MGELGLVMEFCDHRRYSATASYLPYKEGVAGSNPASPTSIKLDFAEKTQVTFAVSALQGAVASAPVLGNLAGGETTARLRDLARASDEHRR